MLIHGAALGRAEVMGEFKEKNQNQYEVRNGS